MKASTQWAMASTPVAAVTMGGTDTVSAGSMIAMSASISTLSVAILFIVSGSVIRARVPTSLPVPAVVGIWTSSTLRFGARFGPEMSRRPLSLLTKTATSFARSMALPPPKPIDGVGVHRLGRRDRGLEVRQVRLRLHVAEHARIGQAEHVEARGVDPVGNDEAAPRADVGDPRRERRDLPGAEADDRWALHLQGLLKTWHGYLLSSGMRVRKPTPHWRMTSVILRLPARRAGAPFWTSGSGSRPAASSRRV